MPLPFDRDPKTRLSVGRDAHGRRALLPHDRGGQGDGVDGRAVEQDVRQRQAGGPGGPRGARRQL